MDLPEESPEGAPSRRSDDAAVPARPDPGRLRASDADRDRVADQLREALAEGRLSPEEHAERLDAVYAAKTYAELAPIVEDLPATGQPAGPPAGPPPRPAMDVAGVGAAASLPRPIRHSANIVAIFSGAERKGRWLVEPHSTVAAVFGGVDLDLRQAVLSQREVTINITCIFGGVQIKVPPGVRVVNSAAAVFGGVQLPDDDPTQPDAPVIRLTGLALFGGIDVKRRPVNPDDAGAVGGGDFRVRQREIQREFHERRRDAHRELRQKHRELRELRRTERDHRRRGR
ncbi:MAG TPA: DUF1707 domain-containing protein [Streptosporangiaceae bacterium]|nr:DUF1707 domain-containing protein [Streptosporangiaceae bacterium]